MGLFGQQSRREEAAAKSEPLTERSSLLGPAASVRSREDTSMSTSSVKASESVLAAGLTVEGKIEGNGNIHVAGRFKGNVNVKGELTIEPGASIDGEVKADTIFVGGEVRGHIVSTSRVEFKESGTLIGDLKAGSLAVAAGSKMRGKVEFGWKEGEADSSSPDDDRIIPAR